MLVFKFGFFILPATYLLTLCSRLSNSVKYIDGGLALLYITSGAIVGKIIYERYQHVQTLSSTVANMAVISFANRTSSFAALFLFLGFLVYLFLFLFQVNNNCLTALNIFVCGFGTLYIWMQCIITNYVSSLYYDKSLASLRRWLGSVSSLVLVIMAVFGTVSIFLPKHGFGAQGGIYICFLVTTLCSYILTAVFCIFVLTFEIDAKYFNDGLQSNLLLDDTCTFNNPSCSETDSLFSAQPSTIIITGSISSMKIS